MYFDDLPVELIVGVFRKSESLSDVANLSLTCRRFYRILASCGKLSILIDAAESEFGPLEDAVQLVTHNASQPAHIVRKVPFSLALLKQVVKVGRVAKKWEDVYPTKKWKYDFERRRLLSGSECFQLRRAIYRLWLYTEAFHNRNHSRTTRALRSVILERAELLHNWTDAELAEIEDVQEVIREVLCSHVCPSNGTIQRKFQKRFPETDQQLLFNIHLNYPPPPTIFQQHFYNTDQVSERNKYYTKYQTSYNHEVGAEGWGDEIPHYYVVEDMLKLSPGQILWLKEHAPLKNEVEAFVKSLGDWFENNGETFGQTLEWVLNERGEDLQDFKDAIKNRKLGIAINDA